MRSLKVLVVEDSMVFRELLVNGINSDEHLQVVAAVSDAYAARDAIIEYRPDVMTLDVELPRMSGLDFLRKLLPQYSIPVVMVSALNATVFDCLAAGAVEFVNKPLVNTPEQINQFIRYELNTKIKIASTAKVGKFKQPPTQGEHSNTDQTPGKRNRIICIGASTGGTEAIFSVIREFRRDIPGVVVVQHMPPGFTTMYAQRLNEQCEVLVKEAETGDKVQRGTVLIAPGDKHMRLVPMGGEFQVECKVGEKVSGHCPSVDVLFQSAAKYAGQKAIGILLTGMGADGAKGLLAMRQAGADTIGQSEATCVVYGMPKVAYDMGAVKTQLSLDNIPAKVYSLLK